MIAPTPAMFHLKTQHPRSNLTDLPAELIPEILRNLNCRDILRCCSVCRRFKEIIDSHAELQYYIELEIDGMIDGPRSMLSPAEKLQLLRSRRKAWMNLDWKRRLVVSMPGSCQAYELVGGVFAKTMATEPDAAGSRHLNVTWLPSSRNDGHSLIRSDLGMMTRDFAIDPSQDLIVLVQADEDNNFDIVLPAQLSIYPRTISSNVQHPDARSPILRCSVLFPITSAFVQIVDDVVGMLLFSEPDGPRIIMWDWKNGHVILDRGTSQLPEGTLDFSFLSSRAYMVTCIANRGSVEIFSFTAPSSVEEPSRRNKPSVSHVASLRLPRVVADVHCMNLQTHTGPFLARCPMELPFATSNESRVHLVTAHYVREVPTGPRRYCFIFHNRTPMAYVRRFLKYGGPPVRVPWEEWGPSQTRFFHRPGPFQWLRYVHGQRVVLPTRHSEGSHLMQVLDFNVKNTERQQHKTPSGTPAMNRLCEQSTIVKTEGIFLEPVVTHLPYRELLRLEDAEYSGIMIDDDRLVGLKYPAFSDGDMKSIHVWTF